MEDFAEPKVKETTHHLQAPNLAKPKTPHLEVHTHQQHHTKPEEIEEDTMQMSKT